MTLVLDTSILIDIEHNNKKTIDILKQLRAEHQDIPHIALINHFEFLIGLKEKKPHNEARGLHFLELFPVLAANKLTSKHLADLKYKYDKKGLLIPLADFLIAAQVIENNMTFVTRDKDYEGIEEMDKIILT